MRGGQPLGIQRQPQPRRPRLVSINKTWRRFRRCQTPFSAIGTVCLRASINKSALWVGPEWDVRARPGGPAVGRREGTQHGMYSPSLRGSLLSTSNPATRPAGQRAKAVQECTKIVGAVPVHSAWSLPVPRVPQFAARVRGGPSPTSPRGDRSRPWPRSSPNGTSTSPIGRPSTR
jgi:hypothetical protein